MDCSVFKAIIEADNKLNKLGTSRDLLLEVVDAVVSARSESTDFDPSGTRGWRGWQMGTRRNREVHCGIDGDDWEKDETDQIASVVSKKRRIRLIVCNTDDGTCIEGRKPRNRSKKGAANERVVDETQLSLRLVVEPEGTVVPMRLPQDEAGFVTYYLCVYHEGDDVRAELSCATQTSGGFFKDFRERIFIVGGEAGMPSPVERKKPGGGDDSEFDIPVTRKK